MSEPFEQQPESIEKNWFIVNTYSAQENKVRASIERYTDSKHVGDRFGRVLVPEEEEQITRGGQRRTIKKKLYPGYVFVEMVMDDETWHIIRSMPGVLGFVSSGNEPQPLQPSEVERLLGRLDTKVEPVLPQWNRGDIVRIVDGPFAESTGRIDEVNAARQKLTVLIEIFGRDTPVSLEFNQVEKI
ncbi:MAG: transcription termination/antitermination protein NusG [Armatimonadota bacterium]|nr:transcription termination/antitermination protein NusG [Armatimonadota bacterium]